MKTKRTENFMREHGIVGMVADKTREAPEVDQLLVELGNTAKAIPFYAVYPGDGRPPIVFSDVPLLQGALLQRLEQAVTPSDVVTQSPGGTYR